MDVFTAIEQRRSIKEFDPNHCMSESEKKQLFEKAILSPTAFNLQHWRFVVLEEKSQIDAMFQLSWNQPQVTSSSLFVIICMDKHAWSKDPGQYWVNAPVEVQELIVPMIDGYYRNNEQAQVDECMRSCGLVGMSLMLVAQQMGYDSCPMDGFDFEKVGKLINLPEDHLIGMAVAIGKPAKDPWPRSGQLPLEKVLIKDQF